MAVGQGREGLFGRCQSAVSAPTKTCVHLAHLCLQVQLPVELVRIDLFLRVVDYSQDDLLELLKVFVRLRNSGGSFQLWIRWALHDHLVPVDFVFFALEHLVVLLGAVQAALLLSILGASFFLGLVVQEHPLVSLL